MKIKYLGTAAGEGCPAPFCRCEVCMEALERGGRNIRSRSQALVDDRLLIDFPPDTFMHYVTNPFPMAEVKHCLITHSHFDHLLAGELYNRAPYYAHKLDEDGPLTIYGSQPTGDAIRAGVNGKYLDFKLVSPYEPFSAGEYTVTALRANHDPKVEPYIYIISKDGKSMLYAHDTGIHMPETWEYFEKTKPYFNFVSLDCTMGDGNNTTFHMGLSCCAEFMKRLKDLGCADDNTIACTNHFSHNGHMIYDDTVEPAQKLGLLVSYDGLEIEF